MRKVFTTDETISMYLSDKSFRCVYPFQPWIKKGEVYRFEYHGDNEYEVKSDNNLGYKFKMTQYELLTCLFPTVFEESTNDAFVFGFWMRDSGVAGEDLTHILTYYDEFKK